jgi:uncharacterized protein (DUF305 family)
MRMRLLVPLLLFGVADGPARGQERHEAIHAARAQATAPRAVPLYTDGDLMFLTHMIVHHQQAIDLAALVPARSDREELRKFARYITGAQHAEIDHMKALLQAAADRGQPARDHQMSGDPPMPGMLSKAQMAALAAAGGVEFAKLWLQGMIQHHQGAIDMALAQQQRDFHSQRQPYGLASIADDILTTQRGEIGMMKTWLAEWGLDDRTSIPGR